MQLKITDEVINDKNKKQICLIVVSAKLEKMTTYPKYYGEYPNFSS